MQRFTRLNRADRSFCLVQAPTLEQAPIVRAYHLELLSRVKRFDYWYLEAADDLLFRSCGYEYAAIAQLLTPTVQPELLTPASRHQFFVATEPAPIEGDETKLMPGVSLLEGLMGFRYQPAQPAASVASLEAAYVSTGDYFLDIEAALLLFRPDQAEWLRQTFSPAQLSQIITYANQHSNPDGEVSEAQRQADMDFFERNQDAITAQIDQHGGGFLF